jgi:galactose mutarotase-like enzyme
MDDRLEISSGEATARIARRGAELNSWRVGGRELIWPGDEKFWPDSTPVLFPVVGWTRDGVVVDGRRYPLGLHGFAQNEDFALVEQAPDRVRLRLQANERTRALYPFAFHFEIEIRIQNNSLYCVIDVKNEGARPMPFACGLHPGFVWPLPGAAGAHVIRFDAEEGAEVPVIAPGGLFSARRRPVPLKGRILPLTPDLFEEALCFLDARSAGLDFAAENGPCLRMELENFPHIALWSRRIDGVTAPFLCLEAWTGYGDPEGFSGDLFAKPSMRLLAPGEAARSAASFHWRA